MTQGSRRVALATGVLGVAAIAVALGFAMLPKVIEAGDCFAPTSVLEFEFATDKRDLKRIFDSAGGVCREKARSAVDQANLLDVFGFIPAYTALNIMAVVFLAGGWRRSPLAVLASGAAVLAAVADYVETINLLAITKVLDTGGEAMLAISTPAAITKFVLLGVHGLATAAICLFTSPRRPILGLALALPPAVTALLVNDPRANYALWAAAVFIAYGSLTLAAFWKAARS